MRTCRRTRGWWWIAGVFVADAMSPMQAAEESAVPPDVARAERLANEGTPGAQVAWGIRHENGDGVPENATEASKWYRRAAEQGDAEGAFRLGFLYARGEGLPKNTEQAAQWYRKAADQGHVTAQLSLGWIYIHGDGIARDVAQALTWFRRAAESGDVNAQHSLGLVLSGAYDDVSADAAEAVRWFERAAKQGMAAAQLQLGQMYAAGAGVAVNHAEAGYWLSLAAKNLPPGRLREGAVAARDTALQHLSAAERDAVAKRVAAMR